MNRLASETSPYLLQHASNPVDWQPWDAEALRLAKELDRPIFLSIGYAACHWCHVMEHESFEDEAIAKLLNELFICIKVDREERPDLDQIYMNAVQLMTGRGGWPMSMFLTPDLRPFYGGTYFPPRPAHGMPSFPQIVQGVADAWQSKRGQVLDQAEQLTAHLQAMAAAGLTAAQSLPPDLLAQAVVSLEQHVDRRQGGFGTAPKFPHPIDLRVMLRQWRRAPNVTLLGLITLSLDKMAAGGIYDQLGGGFHRYSVDERWLVPHFEKMLYDNALLTVTYLEAWQATGRDDYRRVVRETLDYVLREMADPAGGFFSTQDADSEGVEGKFYVWTVAEIEQALGVDRARLFCQAYDVTPAGNFEHANILNRPRQVEQLEQFDDDRLVLRKRRDARIWPGLDDKIIVSWNGLMIDAFAQAGAALAEPRYIEAAESAARFLLRELRPADGRLVHSWRHGQAKLNAYLDDYACLANALVSLYEATFDGSWIDAALELAGHMLAQFHDPDQGGFFYTPADHEQLISRQKDIQDNATPSGNAMAATALLRLGKLCGRADLLSAAEQTLQVCADFMLKHPNGAGQSIIAADFYQGPTPELVLIGDPGKAETQEVLRDLRRRYWPNKLVACRSTSTDSPALGPLFAGKSADLPGPTLHVCEGFTCQSPQSGQSAIAAEFDRWAPLVLRS